MPASWGLTSNTVRVPAGSMVYLSEKVSIICWKYQVMVGGGSLEAGQGRVTLLVPSIVLTSLGDGRNTGGAERVKICNVVPIGLKYVMLYQ